MEEKDLIQKQTFQENFFPTPDLPNATAVLVMGILSIIGCFFYAIPGLILGIISLVLANKAMALYKNNPKNYTQSSFNNVKTGRICAIIGVSLAGISFLIFIIYFLAMGGIFLSAFL
ncbi:CCC motif membrane protein [Aureivirga marina]|uniref:CCC motif membrane protein n=1 Tax=Aureivirga marina TaxID=1182451 RepID=UPI001E63E18B|nr:CCC motif membrane protein [Aureivirga marina]